MGTPAPFRKHISPRVSVHGWTGCRLRWRQAPWPSPPASPHPREPLGCPCAWAAPSRSASRYRPRFAPEQYAVNESSYHGRKENFSTIPIPQKCSGRNQTCIHKAWLTHISTISLGTSSKHPVNLRFISMWLTKLYCHRCIPSYLGFAGHVFLRSEEFFQTCRPRCSCRVQCLTVHYYLC